MAETTLEVRLENGVTLTIIEGVSTRMGGHYYNYYVDGIRDSMIDALNINAALQAYLKKNGVLLASTSTFQQSEVDNDIVPITPDETTFQSATKIKRIKTGMEIINQLNDLFQKEAITKEEYDQLKAQILSLIQLQ